MSILDNAKMRLDISDTGKDTILNYWIDGIRTAVLTYCNLEELPAALEFDVTEMVIKAYEDNGLGATIITSLSDGSQSIGSAIASGDNAVIFLSGVIGRLNRYRKLRRDVV